jgi:quinol monooxygenase YgiN
VAAPSKAEEGNITYHYYEDSEEPNSFIFVKNWKDQTAINLHEETTYFQSFD